MGRKLEWDGEKIKETHTEEVHKRSPKDMIMGLDSIRSQLNAQTDMKVKAEENIKMSTKNIAELESFEKELKEFEQGCVELQKKKILSVVTQEGAALKEAAIELALKTIEKTPDAYNDLQKANMPYLNYQKALATHSKMAENVAPRMIREFLYMEPIFENPFKKD